MATRGDLGVTAYAASKAGLVGECACASAKSFIIPTCFPAPATWPPRPTPATCYRVYCTYAWAGALMMQLSTL